MGKAAKKIIAVILIAAFASWLIFTVFPSGKPGGEDGGEPVNAADRTYEPRFKKEGELFLVEEHDTVKVISIELADNPEEIQYGMMYRKSMDPNTGMLFLMGDDEPRSFWMRNTYVSLDIIYINSRNEVVSIQKNAEPLNDRSLPSEGPASMVLEVKGGFSDQYGIAKGTKVYYQRLQ